jgi:cytochrome c peroxidase
MSPQARWRIRWTLLIGVWVLAFIPTLRSSQGTAQSGGQVTLVTPPGTETGTLRVFGPFSLPRRLADMVMRVPADNPLTVEKIALGRRLFFETSLSSDRSVACATCHDPKRAFTDDRPLAVGVFERVGRRHSPALINRGFGQTQFWDGRAATLETQVLRPIEDRNEMDLSLEEAIARLTADEYYRAAFQTVFERPVSAEDLGRALASYVRSIRSGDAPYDRFIDGETDALSPEQQLGLRVFRTKGRCAFCHREPTFTDEQFWNTGVAWSVDPASQTGSYQDEGRFEVARTERLRGSFKTPTLREVARTAPYMHDGSLATLADVVDFYDKGGRPNRNLMPIIRPLGLTTEEKQALIKFLESLNGVVTAK